MYHNLHKKKSGLVPSTLHYCGHNAKKIGPKKSLLKIWTLHTVSGHLSAALFHGFVVLWFYVFGLLCFYGFVLLQFYGFVLLGLYRFIVCGFVVLCFYGFCGFVLLWFCAFIVLWFCGFMDLCFWTYVLFWFVQWISVCNVQTFNKDFFGSIFFCIVSTIVSRWWNKT